MGIGLMIGLAFAATLGFTGFVALFLRRVVSTNEVHIVQSAKKTISYGKDTTNGNVYYQWPTWLPLLGVTKITLPVNVFSLNIDNYEAYDQGRLPFVVDMATFFRISDSNIAAQRIESFEELKEQLVSIVQGAARSILASNDIETILQGRATFGEQFTKEVRDQLVQWGVEPVKNIELMDIRDSRDSQVIQNIMAKKKSHIEMESRTEVAKNRQAAAIAEIEAQKEVDLKAQNAKQDVGLRTTTAEREVALAQQQKIQAVSEQAKTTKEKEMAVLQVEHVRKSEIARQTAMIKAEQDKGVQVLAAEAQLESKKREADGITAEGNARAEAQKAMELAPVQAQITLAKEIGANKEYQEYLVTVRKVEAAQAVGIEQAKALSNADVKVISNTGNPTEGLTNVMDLFSSKGGTQVGAMLEALSNTDQGQALLSKFVPSKPTEVTVPTSALNGLAKANQSLNGKGNGKSF
jgi:flotillin